VILPKALFQVERKLFESNIGHVFVLLVPNLLAWHVRTYLYTPELFLLKNHNFPFKIKNISLKILFYP
jgi:hypothetical protein